MPIVLEGTETDFDQLDAEMTADEEAAEFARLSIPDQAGDLSDGGMVGGVRISPTQGGVKQNRGRANARRAWRWDGTESLIPLAWETDGKKHDGARAYLMKRHCTCCKFSGFRGIQCPDCIKNNCSLCVASTLRGKIIPCYYLREEDVPFPVNLYGSINCFIELCPRRGPRGFKTNEQMRMHAMLRHRLEYRSYLDDQQSEQATELGELRRQVAALTTGALTSKGTIQDNNITSDHDNGTIDQDNNGTIDTDQEESPKPKKRRKRREAIGTLEAPLYVKDN